MTIPLEAIRRAYDAVAPGYADRFRDELEAKPLDRALLEAFADRVRGRGVVADVGTGPGQVARFLQARGVEVVGVDLSPAMIEEARRLSAGLGCASGGLGSPRPAERSSSGPHPGSIHFRVGNFLALDVPDASLAGLTAFYAHVHVPTHQLLGAFAELHRVLRAGAPALLAFHVGEERIELTEWFERAVRLEFFFHPWAALVDALARSGFVVEAKLERLPHAPLEHPSVRGYVLARRE